MVIRSTTPENALSEPIGSEAIVTFLPRRVLMLSNAPAKSARSRSIRLTKRIRGSLNSSAYSQTFSV